MESKKSYFVLFVINENSTISPKENKGNFLKKKNDDNN